MTLIVEARIVRNFAISQVGFTEQPHGMFDAQARGGLQNAFPNGLSVCRSQPGRVPIDLSR